MDASKPGDGVARLPAKYIKRMAERIELLGQLEDERKRLEAEGNYVGLRRLAAEYRRMNMPQAAAELMR